MNTTLNIALLICGLLIIGCKEKPYDIMENAKHIKSECQEAFYEEIEYRCHTIEVPINHKDKQDKRTITLEYGSYRKINTKPKEIMFINYGGPGSVTKTILQDEIINNKIPNYIKNNYLIIDLNARGTGNDLFRYEIRKRLKNKTYSQKTFNILIKSIGHLMATEQIVEDIDLIRKKMDFERINGLGYSYGSRIFINYLQAHPEQSKAIILNGITNMDYEDRIESLKEKSIMINNYINRVIATNSNILHLYANEPISKYSSINELLLDSDISDEKKMNIIKIIDYYENDSDQIKLKAEESMAVLEIINCVDNIQKYDDEKIIKSMENNSLIKNLSKLYYLNLLNLKCSKTNNYIKVNNEPEKKIQNLKYQPMIIANERDMRTTLKSFFAIKVNMEDANSVLYKNSYKHIIGFNYNTVDKKIKACSNMPLEYLKNIDNNQKINIVCDLKEITHQYIKELINIINQEIKK